MKKSIFIISIVVIIVLILKFNLKEVDYSIVTTSFSDGGTDILHYDNKKLIKKEHYPINEVENVYNDGELLINEYSGELIDFSKGSKKFDIYINPVDYLNFEDFVYILHNEGVNSFSLKKYNKNYEVVLSSKIFKGYPMNFIEYNDLFYVLVNEYDNKSNRIVKLYIINSKDLKYIEEVVVRNQTFGFYIEENNDLIEIYGNKDEDTMLLTLSKYDLLKNDITNSIEVDEAALWVDEVIRTENLKFVVNSFSIIALNEKDEIIKTLKVEGKNLIDCEYNKSKGIFKILAGNHEKEEFEVLTYDKNFKKLQQYKLDVDSKIPTNIIFNK